MSLLQEWESMTPDSNNMHAYNEYWQKFFKVEEGIYKRILGEKQKQLKGTVEELAKYYNTSEHEMIGFLDGIKESLTEEFVPDELEKESEIDLEIDYKKLLFNMHRAKADWLYGMKEWEDILSEEERKQIKKDYSLSGTVHKEKETGRNEPCPCGSGKKYKKCCMKK